MEMELDPSSIGQSFEKKVGESISEAQMEELQAVGPLDQNGELAPEKWLRNSSDSPTPPGAQFTSVHGAVGCYLFWPETSTLFHFAELGPTTCAGHDCNIHAYVLAYWY